MRWKHFCLTLSLIITSTRLIKAADDIVLADFEGKDYGDWKTTGDAFGPGPAQGTLPNQMAVTGFKGHGLANSYHGGDDSIGTLTSPSFSINRSYIGFLIGGGGFAGKTCMNLLVDGKIIRTATGSNITPGGSEALAPASWDVKDLAGKTAVIEIVDKATGGWGHINVDEIVLTDREPASVGFNITREIAITEHYLYFPVRTGSKMRRVSLSVDDHVVREFDIELADAEPQFWASLDASAWRGQTGIIRVDQLSDDSKALKSISQGDEFKNPADLYREPLRPQFHFSPRIGWTNDPNGLVFHQGEYHLFFQHNPYGWAWGNMHWGHAVSPDLVHWNPLPIAIYPHQYGDWVFSGSAIVDRNNSAGFKTGSEDVLVAAFASTGRGECIAYSNDRGRTWTEFTANPVVRHNGRDPRLLWHEPTKKWVMAVYDEKDSFRGIAFYTSPDLKRWEFASRFENFFECPDMFQLPVDGDAKNMRWVLTAASSEYRIGQFDGRNFITESEKLPGQHGMLYAAQTFSDIPLTDGRRIQIGWGRVEARGMPFNQMMCFPCELTLHTTPEGIRMFWMPVREIETIYGKTQSWKARPLKAGENPMAEFAADGADLSAEFQPGNAKEFGFRIRGIDVRYDVKSQSLSCGGNRAPLDLIDGRLRLRVLVDRTSLEIFGNDGSVYMPTSALPSGNDHSFQVWAKGDGAVLNSLDAREVKSIWTP